MNSTALNGLEYTGIVTLSRYINGKKIKVTQIKNSGSDLLFSFLYSCLLGDFNHAKNNQPTQIRLLSFNENETETKTKYTSASGLIYMRNAERFYDRIRSQYAVRFSFLIDKSMYDNSKGFNCVGLYPESATGTDAENFLAVASFPKEFNYGEFGDDSTVLVLDWELSFSNKGVI